MYNPCKGCGGEDCVCCEVWLERQADARYENSEEAYQDYLDAAYEDYGWCGADDDDVEPREDWGDWGRNAMYEE